MASAEDDEKFEIAMQEMAADPQIQAECEAIARDFAQCESDSAPSPSIQEQRYTDPVLRNVTTVSKLEGRFLEKEMRGCDSYWRAYEEWRSLPDDLGAPEPIDASQRMTREEIHERR